MRLPLSENVENAIQQLPTILAEISESIQRQPNERGSSLAQFTTRLADVEARIQKIESLLITKTVAGKDRLTDEGKRIGKLWYEQK